MGLSLVTGPAVEPVTLADAKLQCRVDSAVTDEDDLLQSLVVAARQHAERFTHRAFISQVWDDRRDGFPCEVWEIPLAPVLSITSVTYTDTSGASQTWSSALYRTDIPAGPTAGAARLTPIYGGLFPSAQAVTNAAVLRFTAGYGTTAASVPADIKAAMKLLIGHWYANREAVNVGNIVTTLPHAVEALLWPYKHFV